MPWPWQEEPLHERLAREGGLDVAGQPPHDPTPRWGEVGIHGIARPRQWEVVSMAEAPELPGDQHTFVALPDGTLLVEEELPEGALAPLADAVEAQGLAPPYRAETVRQGGAAWSVGARPLEALELPGDLDGDELELVVRDGERSFSVEGRPSLAAVPELDWLASQRYESYVVRGRRLDGNLWEIQVEPL